ncbi:hypothetical protein ACJJTC_008526 [Scirpophaga incertulas]
MSNSKIVRPAARFQSCIAHCVSGSENDVSVVDQVMWLSPPLAGEQASRAFCDPSKLRTVWQVATASQSRGAAVVGLCWLPRGHTVGVSLSNSPLMTCLADISQPHWVTKLFRPAWLRRVVLAFKHDVIGYKCVELVGSECIVSKLTLN